MPVLEENIGKKLVDLPLNTFRPGSQTGVKTANFILTQGGMGDLIGYSSALMWIAENHKQIRGNIITYPHLTPLFKQMFKRFKDWKVYDRERLPSALLTDHTTFNPSLGSLTVLGCHSVDFGFMAYCQMCPPPREGNYYPALPLKDIINAVSSMAPYAVMTPCATFENRQMPPELFNAIQLHLLERRIVVVWLGATEFSDGRKASWLPEYKEPETNFVGQTGVIQAAKIMSGASVVIGIDNGLLHLAATTDTPIVFGYTVASPEHRCPRRKVGNIWSITPDPKTLSCTFCQSKMRFMDDHDFKECIYKDNKCLEKGQLNDVRAWTRAIDDAILMA